MHPIVYPPDPGDKAHPSRSRLKRSALFSHYTHNTIELHRTYTEASSSRDRILSNNKRSSGVFKPLHTSRVAIQFQPRKASADPSDLFFQKTYNSRNRRRKFGQLNNGPILDFKAEETARGPTSRRPTRGQMLQIFRQSLKVQFERAAEAKVSRYPASHRPRFANRTGPLLQGPQDEGEVTEIQTAGSLATTILTRSSRNRGWQSLPLTSYTAASRLSSSYMTRSSRPSSSLKLSTDYTLGLPLAMMSTTFSAELRVSPANKQMSAGIIGTGSGCIGIAWKTALELLRWIFQSTNYLQQSRSASTTFAPSLSSRRPRTPVPQPKSTTRAPDASCASKLCCRYLASTTCVVLTLPAGPIWGELVSVISTQLPSASSSSSIFISLTLFINTNLSVLVQLSTQHLILRSESSQFSLLFISLFSVSRNNCLVCGYPVAKGKQLLLVLGGQIVPKLSRANSIMKLPDD